MSKKMINELLSIIPGEPAVHLKALIQITIQRIKKISPGRTRDCDNPSREKFQVNASKLMLKMERFVRFIIENAIIAPAKSWYMNWVFAGRLNISSIADPTININSATRIGSVKLSTLKKSKIAINAGMVMARPPSAGVVPSCKAFC